MKKAFIIIALSVSITFHCLIPMHILISLENYRRIIERLIRIETEVKFMIKNMYTQYETI